MEGLCKDSPSCVCNGGRSSGFDAYAPGVLLDLLEAGLADHVLDAAGVLLRGVLIHAQRDQQLGQQQMALIDLLGQRASRIG